MTKEDARKNAEVLLAYAEGKEIESRDRDNPNWRYNPNPCFDFVGTQYRIKPEPKCRPYTVKEMLNIITESRENRRGYPVFFDKSDNKQVFLIAVNNDSLVGKRFDSVYIFMTFKDFLTDCQWEDGAICGVEVAE